MDTAESASGLDLEKTESPFSWSEVKHVPVTSILNSGTMLLAPSGECIGLVTVLNAKTPELRAEVTQALSGASTPAKLRRFMQNARKEAEEYAAALASANARIAELEARLDVSEAANMTKTLRLSDASDTFQRIAALTPANANVSTPGEAFMTARAIAVSADNRISGGEQLDNPPSDRAPMTLRRPKPAPLCIGDKSLLTKSDERDPGLCRVRARPVNAAERRHARNSARRSRRGLRLGSRL